MPNEIDPQYGSQGIVGNGDRGKKDSSRRTWGRRRMGGRGIGGLYLQPYRTYRAPLPSPAL